MPKLSDYKTKARFAKNVLSIKEGETFMIPDEKGVLKEQKITAARLQKWANTFQAMRAAGIRVPAPWSHRDRIGPEGSLLMAKPDQSILDDANKNAGFWTSMSYDPLERSLDCILETPGDLNDPSTPAGKIGTTVQETSIYSLPTWTDGRGRTWEEPILHIGCVVNPIEPGQENFRPVGNELAVCMSFQKKDKPNDPGDDTMEEEESKDPAGDTGDPLIDPVAADAAMAEEQPDPLAEGSNPPPLPPGSEGPLGNIVALLDRQGIRLPGTTTPENFLSFLEVALLQCEDHDGNTSVTGTVTKPPEGAKQKQAPFIMSFSNNQLEAIANAKVVNPATGKPFSLTELQEASKVTEPKAIDDSVIMSHPTVQGLVATTEAVVGVLTKTAKDNYQRRADRLVGTVITQEYADKTLKPMIDAVVMSFENGQPKQTQVDVLLTGFESSPAAKAINAPGFDTFIAMSHQGGQLPPGSVPYGNLPHPLTEGSKVMTAEEAKAKIAEMRKNGIFP